MGRVRGSLPLLVIALAGCLKPTNSGPGLGTQGCKTCGHTSTVGRTGGRFGSAGASSTGLVQGSTRLSSNGGSSSGSSGSSSGTNTGSASGSSSSSGSASSSTSGGSGASCHVGQDAVCPAIAICPALASCPAGSTAFASQLVDPAACSPIAGASIAAIGSDGVPISGAAAVSASDGTFAACLPIGVAFSIEVSAAASPPTYSAEAIAGTFGGNITQLPLISNAEIAVASSFFPGTYDPSKGVITPKITEYSGCAVQAGWTFGVTLPDGGLLPDGGYGILYLGASDLPDPSATSTANTGGALIYNVDTSIADFLVVTATNPAAGDCVPINGDLGSTGRIFVAGGAVSTDVVILGTHVPASYCPFLAVAPTPAACGAGSTPLYSQAVTTSTGACTTVSGASITAVDETGSPIPGAAATTAADGTFALCLPNGGPFSIGAQAPSSVTVYSAEWVNDGGRSLPQALASAPLPGGVSVIAGKGIVEVRVVPVGAGLFECPPIGWSVGLELPDGGPAPAGSYQLLYLDSMGSPGSGATAMIGGSAYIYDIDPTVSSFYLVTASNPDAGGCAPINSSIGMTGRVYVAPGATTVFPLVLN